MLIDEIQNLQSLEQIVTYMREHGDADHRIYEHCSNEDEALLYASISEHCDFNNDSYITIREVMHYVQEFGGDENVSGSSAVLFSQDQYQFAELINLFLQGTLPIGSITRSMNEFRSAEVNNILLDIALHTPYNDDYVADILRPRIVNRNDDDLLLNNILDRLVNDPDSEVRGNAASLLGRLYSRDIEGPSIRVTRVADILLQRFEEERNLQCRSKIAGALGMLRDQEATPVLIEALQSEELSLRRSAVFALWRMNVRDQRITNVMYDCLSDIAPEVRFHAIAFFSRIKDESHIPILLKGLEDETWQVRRQAVLGLERFVSTNEDVLRAVGQILLNDNSASVRVQAARALASSNNPLAINYLIQALEDSDSYVRENVLISLGRLLCNDERVINGLARIVLQSSELESREQAIEVLENMNVEESQRALIYIRDELMDGVRDLGIGLEEFLQDARLTDIARIRYMYVNREHDIQWPSQVTLSEEYISRLRSNIILNSSMSVGLNSAWVLGAIHDQDSITALENLIGLDIDPRVQREAIGALVRMGHPLAYEALRRISDRTNAEMRSLGITTHPDRFSHIGWARQRELIYNYRLMQTGDEALFNSDNRPVALMVFAHSNGDQALHNSEVGDLMNRGYRVICVEVNHYDEIKDIIRSVGRVGLISYLTVLGHGDARGIYLNNGDDPVDVFDTEDLLSMVPISIIPPDLMSFDDDNSFIEASEHIAIRVSDALRNLGILDGIHLTSVFRTVTRSDFIAMVRQDVGDDVPLDDGYLEGVFNYLYQNYSLGFYMAPNSIVVFQGCSNGEGGANVVDNMVNSGSRVFFRSTVFGARGVLWGVELLGYRKVVGVRMNCSCHEDSDETCTDNPANQERCQYSSGPLDIN